MSDYQPIACSFYDVFEIAITRGQKLQARWSSDESDPREGVLTPLDFKIRDGAEWLCARDEAGSDLEVRLDRIEMALPLDA
jgi:transcriptional antiterminator Rof (Rho-off)